MRIGLGIVLVVIGLLFLPLGILGTISNMISRPQWALGFLVFITLPCIAMVVGGVSIYKRGRKMTKVVER